MKTLHIAYRLRLYLQLPEPTSWLGRIRYNYKIDGLCDLLRLSWRGPRIEA